MVEKIQFGDTKGFVDVLMQNAYDGFDSQIIVGSRVIKVPSDVVVKAEGDMLQLYLENQLKGIIDMNKICAVIKDDGDV